jgi:hypothetical protein
MVTVSPVRQCPTMLRKSDAFLRRAMGMQF